LKNRLKPLNSEITEADTSPVDYDSIQRLLGDFQGPLSLVEPEKQKVLLRFIIKDIRISLEAPRGIGRHITRINLFFDFTMESMEDRFELLKKIYPNPRQQLSI
jgi:site-specific DNA recombinase